MSDFYDSLEDECDEIKSTSDSSNDFKTVDCFESTPESESPNRYSFYLKPNSPENEIDLETLPDDWEAREHFLPEIEQKIYNTGVNPIQNLVFENQILYEQGLQLNNDGSITKSPRWEAEELPFITREYRNLQFEKRKGFADNKKVPSPIFQGKNIKNVGKSGESIELKQSNSTKGKRKSCEKVISSNSLFSTPSLLKADKLVASNYNMTDSMKEKLLQNQKGILGENRTRNRNCRKTDSETTSSGISNSSHRSKYLEKKAENQVKNLQFTHRFPSNSNSLEITPKQFKTSNSKIHGYISDISLTTLRPKLNYSERHKLENGYNMYHLKNLIKKVESDTNRSNFGDSVLEELPEVSAVPVTSHSALKDEELFYQKLIEKDKYLKQQNLTARSEGTVPAGKLRSVIKDEKNFFKQKNFTKSKDIDLDAQVDSLVNSIKKCPHFCPPNASTNASKIELALKRRTYGYLANARNIFKLKAQSERKLNGLEEEEGVKINESNSPLSKKASSNFSRGSTDLKKINSTTEGIFPNVKGGLPQYLVKSPRGVTIRSKTKLPVVSSDIHKNFTLPKVRSPKVSLSNIHRNN